MPKLTRLTITEYQQKLKKNNPRNRRNPEGSLPRFHIGAGKSFPFFFVNLSVLVVNLFSVTHHTLFENKKNQPLFSIYPFFTFLKICVNLCLSVAKNLSIFLCSPLCPRWQNNPNNSNKSPPLSAPNMEHPAANLF